MEFCIQLQVRNFRYDQNNTSITKIFRVDVTLLVLGFENVRKFV